MAERMIESTCRPFNRPFGVRLAYAPTRGSKTYMPKRLCFCMLGVCLALLGLPIRGFSQAVVATVPVGTGPVAVAVNSVTNQIYVLNQTSENVTVIDGATNNTTTVPVGPNPVDIAVNSVTNQIYVLDQTSND